MNTENFHRQTISDSQYGLDKMAMRLTKLGGSAVSHASFPSQWEIIAINVESQRTNLIVRACRRLLHMAKNCYWRWKFMSFGDRCRIERPSWIKGACSISLGKRVSLWRYARITAVNASPDREIISIGDGTIIHPHVHITAVKSVTVGKQVLFAANCYVTDHDHDWLNPNDPAPTNERVIAASTSIGDHTWLGEGVAVLKGVRIGDHCVIGANSVVTHDIPAYTIAAGSPARILRRWDHVLEAWLPVKDDTSASKISHTDTSGSREASA